MSFKFPEGCKAIIDVTKAPYFADPTGKAAGRGAYVCSAEECLKKLSDKKLLHKAFSVNVSQEVYKGVEEEVLGEKQD